MISKFAYQVAMIISISFMSALIGSTIYLLVKSWEEGKERYLIKNEIEKQEELKRKKLENLKLENLDIKLTNDDMEILNLVAGNNGTAKGTLRKLLRDHLRD